MVVVVVVLIVVVFSTCGAGAKISTVAASKSGKNTAIYSVSCLQHVVYIAKSV